MKLILVALLLWSLPVLGQEVHPSPAEIAETKVLQQRLAARPAMIQDAINKFNEDLDVLNVTRITSTAGLTPALADAVEAATNASVQNATTAESVEHWRWFALSMQNHFNKLCLLDVNR